MRAHGMKVRVETRKMRAKAPGRPYAPVMYPPYSHAAGNEAAANQRVNWSHPVNVRAFAGTWSVALYSAAMTSRPLKTFTRATHSAGLFEDSDRRLSPPRPPGIRSARRRADLAAGSL